MSSSEDRRTGPTNYEELEAKKGSLKVFVHPVTGYSTVNAEELFAETMSNLLYHGAGRIPEIVLDAFSRALPNVRMASTTMTMNTSNSRVAYRHLQASGLESMAKMVETLESLERLSSEIQTVVDTYTTHVKLPATGRIAASFRTALAPVLLSQTDSLHKSETGFRECQLLVNQARAHLVADPINDEAASIVRDTILLQEKFEEQKRQTKSILSAIFQKVMPENLKFVAEGVVGKLRELLRDPRRVTIGTTTRFVPVAVGDRYVDGMECIVLLNLYPDPKDEAEGKPAYNQFVLYENTLSPEEGVTLVPVILSDKAPDMAKSVIVKTPEAALKVILKDIAGWSKLDPGLV